MRRDQDPTSERNMSTAPKAEGKAHMDKDSRSTGKSGSSSTSKKDSSDKSGKSTSSSKH